MVSRVIPVDAFDLVIFGGTGDLARRKIYPALYHRFRDGQMPAEARVVGAARSDYDDAQFREEVHGALKEFVDAEHLEDEQVQAYLDRVHYVAVDATGTDGWKKLKKRQKKHKRRKGNETKRE